MDDQIASKTQVKCRNKYELFIEINTVVLYGLRTWLSISRLKFCADMAICRPMVAPVHSSKQQK